jgi:hypothetical protein
MSARPWSAKPWLAIGGAAILAAGLLACGGAHRAATAPGAAAHPALPAIVTSEDEDFDSDRYKDEPDNESEPVGHPAGAADARAVAAVVKRYFAAAAREQGAAACALLYSVFEELVAQTYGGVGGAPELSGNSCAEVATKLFRQQHRQLRAATSVKVAAVRISFNRGIAQFGFGAGRPTLYTMLHRERARWKMDEMLYSEHPVYVE